MMCHRFRHAYTCLLASVLVLGLGVPAAAQTVSDWDDSYYPFSREGVFIGMSAVVALENYDKDPLIDDNNTLDISADDAGGFDLRVGYRIHPLFAAEILFQYWAGFEVNERTMDINDKFNGWSLMVNTKLYPLGGRIQPYAVMGIGALVFTEKRGDDADFAARMGAGIDLYLSDSFVVDVEVGYMLPTGSLAAFQFTTIGAGIQYRY